MSDAQMIADIEQDLAVRKLTIVGMRQHCEFLRSYNKRPSVFLHCVWMLSMSLVGLLMAVNAYYSMAAGDDWHMLWYYFIALYYSGFITKGHETYLENLASYQRTRTHMFELWEVLAEREDEYQNIAEALANLREGQP